MGLPWEVKSKLKFWQRNEAGDAKEHRQDAILHTMVTLDADHDYHHNFTC